MTKKILISILALFAIATTASAAEYNIWVGGVKVTDSNKTNITGSAIKKGKVMYEPSTKALVLTDVEIYRNEGDVIANTGVEGLVIIFEGTNKLTSNNNGDGAILLKKKTTISCARNSITNIYAESHLSTKPVKRAVYKPEAPLTIAGSGKLYIKSYGNGIEGKSYQNSSDVMTVKDAKVEIDTSDPALVDFSNITIEGNAKLTLCHVWPGNTSPRLYQVANMTLNDEQHICEPEGAVFSSTAKTIVLNNQPVTNKTIDINAEKIPLDNNSIVADANFRSYLKTTFANGKNYLMKWEAAKITSIDVNNKGISNLQGIEYFTGLTKLDCGSNKLTELNVSKNTALTELRCQDNQLTTLDLSKNTKLNYLRCQRNKFTKESIDKLADNLPTVTTASSGQFYAITFKRESNDQNEITVYAEITAIKKNWKVFGYDEFEESWFQKKQINSTNIPDANFRAYVSSQSIDYNQDGYLSVAELARETELDINNKGISNLKGIRWFPRLTKLYCQYNQLTSLDVTYNSKLIKLYCHTNKIGKNAMQTLVNSLPTVTGGEFMVINTEKTNEENFITPEQVKAAKEKGWKVYGFKGKWYEYAGGVAITATANPAEGGTVEGAGTYEKGQTVTLTAKPNKGYKFVKWTYHKAHNIWGDVANADATYTFTASTDKDYRAVFEKDAPTGIAINATNFPDENFRNFLLAQDYGKDAILTNEEIAAVTRIDVRNKGIADLTGIEHFTVLTNLLCTGNQLTSLDVSANTELTELECSENKLTELNVSQNKKLTSLWCDANQIKGEKMLALVESLPTVTSGNFGVIDTKNSNEGNVCTKSQVAIAKSKGWKVSDYNGGKQQYYEGSDDTTGIEINATNFPDEKFRNFVKGDTIDTDRNGYLSDAEIAEVTVMAVFKGEIKDLTGIGFFTELTYLDCCYNQLTKLDMSKNTKLVKLFCFGNQIKGDAMQALVESLPDPSSPRVKNGAFVPIFTKNPYEGNVITKSQVTIAKNKHWRVYDYDPSNYTEYEGSDDTTGVGASLNDNGKMTNDSWYTIDGVKLQGEPTKKGVYIIKGKKVKR